MKTRLALLGLTLVAFCQLGSGCSDNPTDPVPVVRSFSTQSAVVEAFTRHLQAQDTTGFMDLFREDFRLVFSEGDVRAFGLPTDHMYAGELQVSYRNLFSGQSVQNFRGEPIPAVLSFEVENMERIMVWAPAEAESGFPGTWTGRYWTRLRIDLDDEIPPFSYISVLDFYIEEEAGQTQSFRLAGIKELVSTLDTGASFSFGSTSFRFFTNEPPVSVLSLDDLSTRDDPALALSGCESFDPECRVAPLGYAVQFGNYSSSPAWEGCRWVMHPGAFVGGEVTLTVEDRWGLTARTSRPFEFDPPYDLPFADGPEQLMANFRVAYRDMQVTDFQELLHADFKLIISAATRAAWADGDPPLPASHFNRTDALAVHANIFAGQPGGGPAGETVSGVTSILVSQLESQSDWGDIRPDDPDFGGAAGRQAVYKVGLDFIQSEPHRLVVDQTFRVFAAPVAQGGREHWLLLGLRSLDDKNAGYEKTGLDLIHAIYR